MIEESFLRLLERPVLVDLKARLCRISQHDLALAASRGKTLTPCRYL